MADNAEIPNDPLSDELMGKIASNPSWVTPCTFDRINRMPLDSKQCFDTYQDLIDYIGDEETTAYPGMFVAVVNRNDPKRGAYVLTISQNDNEEERLVPTKLGAVNSIKLTGDIPNGETEPSEINATIDENGNAVIDLSDVQFGDIEVDSLVVDGSDIYELIPQMAEFKNISEIPENQNTHENVVSKLNEIVRGLKAIAQRQNFVYVENPTSEDDSGTGN